jgi:hypothetical protein
MTSILMQVQTSGGGTGAGIFVGGLFVVFLIVALVASIFWIWMLIDCLTSNLPTGEKVLWALVILFLHLLGAIIYFAVGRGKRSSV